MASEGYWAVCEEFALPQTPGGKPSATLTMIAVRGFFYADAMGHTRMEALRRTHEKLKENIRFYLACGLDLPPLNYSDTVPKDYHKRENTTLLFISLKDIGMEFIAAEQKKAANQ